MSPAHGFGALRHRPFSLYLSGQIVTQGGTWFQNLAVSLTVLEVNPTAAGLALVSVAQFTPAAILAPWAGRTADRIPPRMILIATSGGVVLITSILAAHVLVGEPNLLLIYALVFLGGCFATFERVAAQAFIVETTGTADLQSGVVLTSIGSSVARALGPAAAGVTYAAAGATVCLVINALSSVIVVVTMLLIRARDLQPRIGVGQRDEGRIGEALRYVLRHRALLTPILVNSLITVFAMNLNLTVTAVVTLEFAGSASDLGLAHTLNAIGGVIGGLVLAAMVTIRAKSVVWGCLVYGAALLVNGLAPGLGWFLLAAPILGVGLGIYHAIVHGVAQQSAPPHMLGRVMSLIMLGQFGFAPIGALYVGVLIDATSGQTALVAGAVACAACAALSALLLRPLGRAHTIQD